DATATLTGAQVVASAGVLSAGQAQPQQEGFGGGFIRADPSVGAVARITGAQARSRAGTITASAGAVVALTGAGAKAQAGELTGSGSSVVPIRGVSVTASAGQLRATGIEEISDDEILVLLMAA
ncbi:MAG: hypothetical protein M3R16_06365, partial [Pseudomonadota bacterium]|nr:hypothetical protein [Pseudomonadota bacterium]